MNDAQSTLAKLLHIKPDVLLDLEAKLAIHTGKKGIIESIVHENDVLVHRTLDELGIMHQDNTAEAVFQALVQRLEYMDDELTRFFGQPDLSRPETCTKMIETAKQLYPGSKGLFLKQEKAVEMLEKFPPLAIMEHFGCKTVAELLQKHDVFSIFSALRFVESNDWMHQFFDAAYSDLTADDFEEREVQLLLLDKEWLQVAEKFLTRKYHNVSHLKELGVIFIIPITIDTKGEILRLFSLLLHYFNEVPFYANLIRRYIGEPNFSSILKSLLRGDVPGEDLPNHGKVSFRIVQRYLAKDNPADFRLFEPHVNPEAEHWFRAEKDFAKLGQIIGTSGHLFGYWHGLDFVGSFFKDAQGGESLISFDLIDLTMSLLKQGDGARLHYHQQEALWNKLFVEYLGNDVLEQKIEEHIMTGFITL